MALSKKVLVVDDEDTIRETLALGLSDFGWEVTKCPSCSSALEHETPFDV
jgi:DNA-binding response OmpR family regulator